MNLGSPASKRLQVVVAAIVLAVAAALLLARLGRYALWDDEAITALTAQGVQLTGDTSAVIGHNVLAYRNGLLLRNWKDRATPPLQFYLVAPFFAVLGPTAFAARLPFALCGFLCIAVLLWWLHKADATPLAWILLALAILGNVSFFLFARQARYYGLAMLLATAVAYSYLHNRSRRGVMWHALVSCLLLAANYMTFAAVSVAMGADYLIWGRKRRPLRVVDWAILLIPQAVTGAIVLSILNPMKIAADESKPGSWIGWKLTLLWWNIRDLNAAEFGVGALLVAAPIVAVITRSVSLIRALLALAICIVCVTILSPQAVSNTAVADVRYLSFLIPLCIAIGVMVLLPLRRLGWPVPVFLSLLAFGTNALHGTPFWGRDVKLRSTPFSFLGELWSPPPEPFTPVADWIRKNVRSGESVFVLPQHMAYPLMFHAPQAVYAWQLPDPPAKGLEGLPPIHYVRRVLPDYIILFAPGYFGYKIDMPNYRHVESLDVLGKDAYRPELFWHIFEPITGFDPRANGIHIYKREIKGLDLRL